MSRRKRQQRTKNFSIFAIVLMIISLFAPTVGAQSVGKNGQQANQGVSESFINKNKLAENKVSSRLIDEFSKDEHVTFLVKFAEKADVETVAKEARKDAESASLSAHQAKFSQRSAVINELKTTALDSQARVKDFAEEQMKEGNVKDFHSYHIVNGMAMTATKEVAEKIASFAEVEKILPDETRQLFETTVTEDKVPQSDLQNVEWNVERVGAPEAWNMGIDGSGTVVASLDSGVEWDHPALKEKYRGYDAATGSVEHEHSFFDATAAGQEAAYDDHGHGTHVTGTMVGSEPDGSNQVGVAPGAEWIAVKVFDGGGSTSDSILLAGAQWLLAPGDRADLAPDVVNNSWGGGPGIDEWYRDTVRAWRAAEIFPEFSAGNTDLFNPGGPGSIAVPANYPESFATGATDSDDMIASFSLRGPSPYDEIKPEISAPGVNIRSSVPGGGYEGGWNGTSMSGPAVSAVAAMLRQVNANISVDDMEQILMETATPRTDDEYPDSPNNGYGHGIVNAHDAVSSILDGLGTVEGMVTKDGEDNEAPTFEHDPITETYSEIDVPLTIQASDNVSITSVELNYRLDEGETVTVEADRVSGDYKDGEYEAVILGSEVEGETLTYSWTINDYGNNTVESDEYTVDVMSGITVGYYEDFETKPVGWHSFGSNDSWEWGVPTSGPEEALTGDHVYATNLDGDYSSSMDATLVMPPMDLPEGEVFLKVSSWHNFEQSSSGRDWDYGELVVSTDMENWEELHLFGGESDGYEDVLIDLDEYSGRVYVGFRAYSDTSVTRPGWYIDHVDLFDASRYSDDEEAPVINHEAPAEAFSQFDLHLQADVTDNVRINTVELQYQNEEDEWSSIEAEQTSGGLDAGTFETAIPAEDMQGESMTYRWYAVDFNDNETYTDEYTIPLEDAITVGYSQDFESVPSGWFSFGENDTWEWGEPTSGPESAASGDNVYATNLSGNYDNYMDATLVMPPVELPEGDSFLKFKSWHSFEESSSGRAWDYGHVVISTDMEEWDELDMFQGDSDGWEDVTVDLSDYSGEVYLGFYTYSDVSINRPGWYIDDVQLTDESENGSAVSLGLETDSGDSLTNHLATDQAKQDIAPTALPLQAQVSVLETGRSTTTNPADGSYSFVHAAGDLTLVAEAYGYRSEEQSINLEADETVNVNFTLDELPQATLTGTVTNERTGNPVKDATVMLIEDANIEPVETNEDGTFSLTAYEGTYTLRILAPDFHQKDVEVTLDSDKDLTFELEPFYTIPGGEIGYDDGSPDNARSFYDAGNGWAVKMSLPEDKDKALVTDGVFRFWDTEWPVPGGTDFQVEVWDASGSDGLPGEKIAGPIDAEAKRDGTWTVVDLREHNIMVEGDFYMVYIQTDPNPLSPGLATDETSPNAGRSYQLVGGAWSKSPTEEGNYMIRARVAYEVDTPVITTPDEEFITNEPEITVEGTASPSTTVKLLNNGEEVGTSEIDDDGTFSFTTELTEGDNEFTAVTLIDGDEVSDSDPVTIILDTIAPELAIDHPVDGDKTNRETVTVEGTVADDNLDTVTVNGQDVTVEDNGDYAKRIILDEGENTIEVVATDLAGNSTTETVTIEAKYTAPEITNVLPDEDKHLNVGETVLIEFESEPGLRGSFVLHMPLTNLQNVTELPMVEQEEGRYVAYWTVPSNFQADGAVVEVIATDTFGNESREQADGKIFVTE